MGGWGTALALAAHAAGREVTLWVREKDVLEALGAGRENRFLPGVTLPKDLVVTGDLMQAAKAEALLLTVPAQVLHAFTETLAPHLTPGTPMVICAKGIEKGSGKSCDRSVEQKVCTALPRPRSYRDRPLHAMWRGGLPTAVTIAA